MTIADITSADVQPRHSDHPLGRPGTTGRWLLSVFGLVLAAGLIYIFHSLGQDFEGVRAVPWVLLGSALVIASTSSSSTGSKIRGNAVAAVIYTRSIPADLAVLWPGFFNFLGALLSNGAVGLGIIASRREGQPFWRDRTTEGTQTRFRTGRGGDDRPPRQENEMPEKTLFVVQQFERMGKRLVAGRLMEFKTAAEAQGRADRDATRTAGVVALKQTIDTDTGEVVEDPVVLARHGELPAEFDPG